MVPGTLFNPVLRFPLANTSLENFSQVSVIGPAYNNMSFLVVGVEHPSLDWYSFVFESLARCQCCHDCNVDQSSSISALSALID